MWKKLIIPLGVYSKHYGNTANEPYNFRTRNWDEINDESWGTYYEINQIKLKTSMIRSNICNYSDAYIHVKGVTSRNYYRI